MPTYSINAIYVNYDDNDAVDQFAFVPIQLITSPDVDGITYYYDDIQQTGMPTSVDVDATGIYDLQFGGQYYDPDDRMAFVLEVTWGDADTPSVSYVLNTSITLDGGGDYIVFLGGDALPDMTTAAEWGDFNNSIIGVQDVPPGSPYAAGQEMLFADLPMGYTVTDDDQIGGTPGDDSLSLGDGTDWFTATLGDDTLDGGDGSDLVFYEELSAGVSVSLDANGNGTATKVNGDADTLISIENLHGSHYNDTISVGTSGYVFDRGGDDSVTSTAGHTLFIAGSGDDTFTGTAQGYDGLDYSDDGYDLGNPISQGIDVTMTGAGEGVVVDGWGDVDSFSGIDAIRGSQLGDEMDGSDDDDVLFGNDGDDLISGGDGDDEIEGEDGDDLLFGDAGEDTLVGGDGDDYLNPGNSDHFDVLVAGAGEDVIDFGDIQNSYENPGIYHGDLNSGITVTIDGPNDVGVIDKGANGETTILDVGNAMNAGGLNIFGTSFDDLFTVTPTNGGFIAIEAEEGNDTIIAGPHNGTVRLDYHDSDAQDGIVANLATGVVANDGFGYTDTLQGQITEIRGNDLNDSITGSDADYERYILEQGNDTVDGAGGWDVLRYNRSGVGAINADMAAGTVTGTWDGYAFTDSIANIEEIRGSYENDVISALGITYEVELNGHRGDDTLIGGSNNDMFYDQYGDNSMSGGDGEDYFEVTGGNHSIDGGADYDSLEINDFSSEAMVLNFTDGASGDVTFLAGRNSHDVTAVNYYGMTPVNVERFVFDYAGDLLVLGDDNRNTIALLSLVEFLDFQGGGGVDQLQLHRLTVDGDDTRGLTLAEFETGVGIDGTADNARIFDLDTDETYGYLTDVEEIRFADQTVLLSDLLTPAAVTINGDDNGNTLTGTTSAEIINGFGGWDWITPAGGNDTVDGGDGRDMVNFVDLADTPGRTNTQYRLDIDLEAGTAVSHDGSEQIIIQNFERVTGSIFADKIRGTAGDDQLRGLGDYDWFTATSGDDTYDGGNGKDMISYLEWENTAPNTGDPFSADGAPPASATVTGVVVDLNDTSNNTNLAAGHTYISIERVTGSGRQDVFYGTSESNDFRGLGDYDWFVSSEGGRERYFGGDGIDTVTYYNATAGVSAGLKNGAVVNGEETGRGTGGVAALDLYFSIESLVGSHYDDSLGGSSDRNMLSGLDGDDFLFSYGGIDSLKGGAGDDTIDGGAGSDYAYYDGDAADYTLTKTAWNAVTISGAAEGTDSLIAVEYFVFADQTIDIWSLPLA